MMAPNEYCSLSLDLQICASKTPLRDVQNAVLWGLPATLLVLH